MKQAVFFVAIMLLWTHHSYAACDPQNRVRSEKENKLMSAFSDCMYRAIKSYDDGKTSPQDISRIIINTWCADEVETWGLASIEAIDKDCNFNSAHKEKSAHLNYFREKMSQVAAAKVMENRAKE